MFDEHIDCKLKPSELIEDRVLNWNRINLSICFNYLQQRFYLVEPTMNALAKGKSSDSIVKLLKVMISTQQEIFAEAIQDTSGIKDITDEIETDRSLFNKDPQQENFESSARDGSPQANSTAQWTKTIDKDEEGEWRVPAYIEE